MKLQVIVALCMFGAAGCLMGMLSTSMQKEEGKARLNFLVDSDQLILRYSKEHMDYFIEPSDFVGKDITEVVPLNETDRKAVLSGFGKAAEKNETVKVPYTLDSENFVAKITPLKRENSRYNYFVKVQEAEK